MTHAVLCNKCGLPITGQSGRCVHCDPPPDAARSPSCVVCTAPLLLDDFGAIICTGCNRSEQLCGCGPGGAAQGFEPEKVNVSSHMPKAKWWFARLQRLIAILRGKGEELNRDGAWLVKFAVYSTFVDLAEAAMAENNRKIYDQAVALIRGTEKA